jgi:hypothetical protein
MASLNVKDAHRHDVRRHTLIKKVLDAAIEHFHHLGRKLLGSCGLHLLGLLSHGG